jgi:hypothetical protein
MDGHIFPFASEKCRCGFYKMKMSRPPTDPAKSRVEGLEEALRYYAKTLHSIQLEDEDGQKIEDLAEVARAALERAS